MFCKDLSAKLESMHLIVVALCEGIDVWNFYVTSPPSPLTTGHLLLCGMQCFRCFNHVIPLLIIVWQHLTTRSIIRQREIRKGAFDTKSLCPMILTT